MTFASKLRAHAWLMLINALFCILIATRYFAFLPEFPSATLAQVFLVSGTLSQMALLSFILGVLILPVLWLPSLPRNLLQAGVACFGLACLFIDTLVFAQYRFHINFAVLELVMSGQIVSFAWQTWLTVLTGCVVLFIGQLWLIRHLESEPVYTRRAWGRRLAGTIFAALLLTNTIHVWAAANAFQPVTMLKRYLPLFYPATANSFMRKQGWIDEEAVARQKAMSLARDSDLQYPLQPLETQEVDAPVNIMLIVVDSWRADTLNEDNTPHIWNVARNGKILSDHMASGNATRMGIFGLFYGLPGTYWHSFLVNQQPPVLITRMQELSYQMGIFGAAQLQSPEFDRTVFASIDNLRIRSDGNTPAELDRDLTDDWKAWYSKRDTSQPTFSFLFYDAPHGYDFPNEYPHRYEPMLEVVNYLELNNNTDPQPFMNRYKTSVHYVDSLVREVLEMLQQQGDLDNTLLIITGDHGQEMNDNKLNYWGHNSNFTRPQVQVPFVIAGPGVNQQKALEAERMTSHHDVAPTLLKNYLGVASDPKDYAVGEDLFAEPSGREWLLAAKYSGYAVITENSILEVGATGQYEYLDSSNREIKDRQPDFSMLQEALEQISRFRK
jgi:membrane-anchored protein YejM (alkaline phosphatase superfamily)